MPAHPIATSDYLSGGRRSPKPYGGANNQDLSDIYRDTFLQRPSASAMDKLPSSAMKEGPIQEKDLRQFELIDKDEVAPLVTSR